MENSFFQLKGLPQIKHIDFDINNNFTLTNIPIEIDLKFFKKVKMNIEKREAEYELVLEIFRTKELSQVPFQSKISMIAIFTWTEDTDSSKLNIVMNSSAPAIITSYIRPIITQFTTFSGYTPLILPLVNFSNGDIADIE